jgi:hypothetical protein
MSRISCFDNGKECYLSGDYSGAVEWFLKGLMEEHCSDVCRAWLGYCYELGLGVEKELVMAKDLYETSRAHLLTSEREGAFGKWINERLEGLEGVKEDEGSVRRKIEGVGNVRVTKLVNIDSTPQWRYNKDEVVVVVSSRESLLEGFCYAERYLPEKNRTWSCDGKNRFYDGYIVEADYYRLEVRRGDAEHYSTRMEGRELRVTFPNSACLEYLYVQETIFRKVKELLWKKAQEVIPPVLERVAQRIGVEYGKCEVVKSLRNCAAYNYALNHDITFSSACVQLPKESLEALCVHELTHNFVSGHGRKFDDKMIELGGEKMLELYNNLWNEGRWAYMEY